FLPYRPPSLLLKTFGLFKLFPKTNTHTPSHTQASHPVIPSAAMSQPPPYSALARQPRPRPMLFLICAAGYSFIQRYPLALARLAHWARLVCVRSESELIAKWNLWIANPAYRISGFVLVDGAILEPDHRPFMNLLHRLPHMLIPYDTPRPPVPNPRFHYVVALDAAIWASSQPERFQQYLRSKWDTMWTVMAGFTASVVELTLTTDCHPGLSELWFKEPLESRAVFITGPPAPFRRTYSIMWSPNDALLRSREEARRAYADRVRSPCTGSTALPSADGILYPDVEPGLTNRPDRLPPDNPWLRRRRRQRAAEEKRNPRHHFGVAYRVLDFPERVIAFVGLLDDLPEVGALILDVCEITNGNAGANAEAWASDTDSGEEHDDDYLPRLILTLEPDEMDGGEDSEE
ncbi:uncharacterized protein BO97DRAFT_459018, partial [Aspergillus homomorphus CBS 101889]